MNTTIVFIDDELDILTISTFRLKKLGYRVLTASNGQEGLELIRREQPALVFLDLLMPIMDGYEVCRILKSDETLKKIPVVLFTAVEDDRVNRALKETGADDFLVKPYEPAQLLDLVSKYVKSTPS